MRPTRWSEWNDILLSEDHFSGRIFDNGETVGSKGIREAHVKVAQISFSAAVLLMCVLLILLLPAIIDIRSGQLVV